MTKRKKRKPKGVSGRTSTIPPYTYALIDKKKTTWPNLVKKHGPRKAKQIWRRSVKWIDWKRHDKHYGRIYGNPRRKSANPPMSFVTMALSGAGAYLLYKYVFKKS
jgi:hypothetical protein